MAPHQHAKMIRTRGHQVLFDLVIRCTQPHEWLDAAGAHERLARHGLEVAVINAYPARRG